MFEFITLVFRNLLNSARSNSGDLRQKCGEPGAEPSTDVRGNIKRAAK